MRRWIVVLTLTLAPASPLDAAPGDPRLVQGILEWPAKLTSEPFIVIRTEDGRWYYAELNGAKRLDSAPMTAGARVTVLGTEAARPHEITVLAVGSGDAAALALALMSQGKPAPPASSPSLAPTAESPKPSPVVAVSAPKTVTRAEPAAAPAPASAPAPTPRAKAPQPPASDPTPPAHLPVNEPPKEKATALKRTTPSDASSHANPSAGASTKPASGPRWSEIRGTVHSVAGHEVVVRAEDGQLVPVDLSSLRGASISLTPGAPVIVYGMHGDEKFQAIGLIQQETRPQAKPVAAPQRR